MAKKRKAAVQEAGGPGHGISASARQIWYAGLGAFAATRRDGGKLFDALVRDGEQLHQLTRELGRDKVPDMAGKAGRLVDDVARQASASLEKIEQYFEARIASAMHRIGVPSRDEVEHLRHEVGALEAALKASAPSRAAARGGAQAVQRGAPNGPAGKRLN